MEKKKPTRNRYTDEFRQEAVALVTEQGYSVKEAAESLGLSEQLLYRWKKKLTQPDPGISDKEREELKQLRKENKRLKMEQEILKKASAFFAKDML